MCQLYIDSMEDRLKEVIKREGKKINYGNKLIIIYILISNLFFVLFFNIFIFGQNS